MNWMLCNWIVLFCCFFLPFVFQLERFPSSSLRVPHSINHRTIWPRKLTGFGLIDEGSQITEGHTTTKKWIWPRNRNSRREEKIINLLQTPDSFYVLLTHDCFHLFIYLFFGWFVSDFFCSYFLSLLFFIRSWKKFGVIYLARQGGKRGDTKTG